MTTKELVDSASLTDDSIVSDSGDELQLFDDGELAILSIDLIAGDEGQDGETVDSNKIGSISSQNVKSVYGCPLSEEEAKAAMPYGDGGLIWHATVIPDEFFLSDGSLIRGLNKRDFDSASKTIKTRRPSLPLTMTQLFSSLTKIDGPTGPRYIFHGVLNGWPSLRTFELIELEKKRSIGPLTPPDYMNSSKLTWAQYWNVAKEGKEGIKPEIKDKSKIYRATLRGAQWTSVGWSPESHGFMFWYESIGRKAPRVSYGSISPSVLGDDKCSMVHMISHRYAVAKETTKDMVTYHSVVLLEWEHGQYCTVVEGAWLNGIGGFKGKSNWFHDRDDVNGTALYKSFPPEMVCPWLTSATEVRCYDVEAKSLDEMKEYIATYEGPDKRFIDPQYTFSHPARLYFRSKSNIAQYLVNYISRDASYSQLKRNCQTLAADLCCFIAGKKNVAPYHPINRIDYHNRTHLFLYDSGMFSKR